MSHHLDHAHLHTHDHPGAHRHSTHDEHSTHGQHGTRGRAGHSHHHAGPRGWLERFLPAHSHDPADAADPALTASADGIRAVTLSLLILGVAALAQLGVVALSGSVALLSDTIHNLGDALTAIPLWIAFSLGRRGPSATYTYGFGRVEQLAGLTVLAVIAGSAIVAAWEAIDRILHPRDIDHLGWVAVAGLLGFAANEIVARLRIRVGRRIGSAALVADGVHARTDGLTSLAVVAGCAGVWLGWPLADPIIGLVIAVAIAWMLVGAAGDVLRRVLDGVEPAVIEEIAHGLGQLPEIRSVQRVRARWVGLQLIADAEVRLDAALDLREVERINAAAETAVRARLPRLAELQLRARPR